jgi:signal transduction histidine kinase
VNDRDEPAPTGTADGQVSRAEQAADAERTRIERDIHDGVQQRLRALRIRLAMAAERFDGRGEADAGAALRDFGSEVEIAIDELGEMSRGVYPQVLQSDGLLAALGAAAEQAPHPVVVTAEHVGRYPAEVESAVYFSVLAALDNAARYAGTGPVTVALYERDGRLAFSVSDSGEGFRVNGSRPGAGLANMRDRIAAVDGIFMVESSRSTGTRVTGTVPDLRA